MTAQLLDLAGRPVRREGGIWFLNEPGCQPRLDWNRLRLPRPVMAPANAYVANVLATGSNGNAMNGFRMLHKLSLCQTLKLRRDGTFGPEFFSEMRYDGCGPGALSHARTLYCYAADNSWPGFARSVAMTLGDTNLEEPCYGEFVKRGREDQRPPNSDELKAIASGLRGPIGAELDPDLRAATAAALAFGPNATPLVLLRVDDLGGGYLSIPRHKKGGIARADFRDRKVDGFLERVLTECADYSRQRAVRSIWPDGTVGVPNGVALPLFARTAPFGPHADISSPMREYALHHSRYTIARMVRRAVRHVCPDLPLVSPRRMRAGLASSMLGKGYSAWAIADVLDHDSGPDLVLNVYAAGGARLVEHLDNALNCEEYRRPLLAFAAALGVAA